MKEILIKLKDEKINKKLFSQALKAVSIDSKEEQYLIDGNDTDVSLFSSYSNEIKMLEEKDKNFNYEIVDESINEDKTTFNIFNSFNKRFVLLSSSSNNFDDFFKLNEKYNEDFFIFSNDKEIKRYEKILNDPSYKGEKKIEDIFYDDTHLILVSEEFLNLFNDFILSISNYFFKRYELKNQSKGGFLSNLGKNLFSWGSSNEEPVQTLFNDLTSKYKIEYSKDKFYLILKEENTASSFMSAIRFFLSIINDKIDFDPIYKK